MSTLTKEALKAEVIATLGDGYEPNEADIKMVAHIMEAENKDLEDIIWCHVRLDSITKRLMHKGWFAFDEYYFADDDTALDFLKNRGIKNVAEMDINRNEYLHYQQWWPGEIPA